MSALFPWSEDSICRPAMDDYGRYMEHEDDCQICARQIALHRSSGARPVPTARSLVQRERDRVMADGEDRLAALLARPVGRCEK